MGRMDTLLCACAAQPILRSICKCNTRYRGRGGRCALSFQGLMRDGESPQSRSPTVTNTANEVFSALESGLKQLNQPAPGVGRPLLPGLKGPSCWSPEGSRETDKDCMRMVLALVSARLWRKNKTGSPSHSPLLGPKPRGKLSRTSVFYSF